MGIFLHAVSPWMARLLPALPLLAVAAVLLSARRAQGKGHIPTAAAMSVSLLLSVVILAAVIVNGPMEVRLSGWSGGPGLPVPFGLTLDRLTAVMLVLVTGISTLVHLYAVRYMHGDPGYDRFFILLSFTTWAVTMVVLSDNLLMLFVFWELVGIGLYLLLSHQRARPPARAAARRMLLITLAADFPFLTGIVLAFSLFGTLNIHRLSMQAHALARVVLEPLGWLGLPSLRIHALTVVALLMFLGAAGRSAQLPFHPWLPDTMDTPTPVSALMHAGIVNSGGFLIARFSAVFHTAPLASDVVFLTGAATALYGTTLMMAQPDIKRSLGYSTMGQMGYMMMEDGLGVYAAAVFHLIAHGLFKASQFLGAGGAATASGSHGLTASALWQPHRAGTLSGLDALVITVVLSTAGFAAADILLRPPPAQAGAVLLSLFAWATAFWAASGLYRASHVLPWKAVVITGLLLGLLAAGYTAGVSAFAAFLSPAVVTPQPAAADGSRVLLSPVLASGIGFPVAGAVLLRILPAGTRQRLRVFFGQAGDILYVLALNRGYEDEWFNRVFLRPLIRVRRWAGRLR